jgi:hypothetical protein
MTILVWMATVALVCYCIHGADGFHRQRMVSKPTITIPRQRQTVLSSTVAAAIGTNRWTVLSPSVLLSTFINAPFKGKMVYFTHSVAIVVMAWLVKSLVAFLMDTVLVKVMVALRGNTTMGSVATAAQTKIETLTEPVEKENKSEVADDNIPAVFTIAPSSGTPVAEKAGNNDSNSAVGTLAPEAKESPTRKREKGWDWDGQVPQNTPTYKSARFRLDYVPKEKAIRVAAVPIVNKEKDEVSDAEAKASAKKIADLLL